MSDDGLQISDALIGNLVNLIAQHDERANEDMMLGLQYLAAVSGYIAASYPGNDSDREELLQHLAAFTSHVAKDRAKQMAQASAPQQAANEETKGRSVATEDPAVGIWKPEQ